MQLLRVVGIIAVVLLFRPAEAQTTGELNTIADICAAVRTCWKSPNISAPAEMTVRLSFSRDVEILGNARVTYENKTSSRKQTSFSHPLYERF